MDAAIITVGDEILSGDISNSNAAWLASQLADRGVSVERILTLPDQFTAIDEAVREWSKQFDVLVVTGGLGGTHDDVTLDAVANAFDRKVVVDDEVRERVIDRVAAHRGLDPAAVAAGEADIDIDAWSTVPEGSRPLENSEGLCAGFVLENVYVFPGVPEEVKAVFAEVADEFSGGIFSITLTTSEPEAAITETIFHVQENFEVQVSSYPDTDEHNRVKLIGTDQNALAAALTRLREELEVVEVDGLTDDTVVS